MPRCWRSFSIWRRLAGLPSGRIATSSPPITILPPDGVSRKLMQRSMVDLPEPEPPMIATTSPSQALSDTPFSTSSVPKDFFNPSMRMASGRGPVAAVSAPVGIWSGSPFFGR